MIHYKHLPYHFLDEAMNIACHIQNRVTIHKGIFVTHYEIWKGKPNLKYFHVF